jgi:hypothetical protein
VGCLTAAPYILLVSLHLSDLAGMPPSNPVYDPCKGADEIEGQDARNAPCFKEWAEIEGTRCRNAPHFVKCAEIEGTRCRNQIVEKVPDDRME